MGYLNAAAQSKKDIQGKWHSGQQRLRWRFPKGTRAPRGPWRSETLRMGKRRAGRALDLGAEGRREVATLTPHLLWLRS